MKIGDLSVTSISIYLLRHVGISSLKLNASLNLYSISITCFFLHLSDMIYLNVHICLIFPYLAYVHHLDLTMDISLAFLPFFPSLMYL